jgi:hypothetical protein
MFSSISLQTIINRRPTILRYFFYKLSLNNPEINESFTDYSSVWFGKAFRPRIKADVPYGFPQSLHRY